MDKDSTGNDAKQQKISNLKTEREKQQVSDSSKTKNVSGHSEGIDSTSSIEENAETENPYAPAATDYGDPRGMDRPGEPDYLHPDGTPTRESSSSNAESVQQSQSRNADRAELNLRSANSKESGIEEMQRFDAQQLSSLAEKDTEESRKRGRSTVGGAHGVQANGDGRSRSAETYGDDGDRVADEDRTADPLARNDYADPRRLTSERADLSDDDTPDYMHPEGKNNS